jgi:hypothetical protein
MCDPLLYRLLANLVILPVVVAAVAFVAVVAVSLTKTNYEN